MNIFVFESIAIEISIKGTKYFLGHQSFMPFYDDLLTFLEICNNKSSKSIICSDTNINLLKHSKESVNKIYMNISTGFYNLNHCATRFSNKDNFYLMDHIITNNKPKNTKPFQYVQSISDHNIIYFPH